MASFGTAGETILYVICCSIVLYDAFGGLIGSLPFHIFVTCTRYSLHIRSRIVTRPITSTSAKNKFEPHR